MTTQLKLLLTCDYEVFGDGSGDINECVIAPANRLMDICEKYNARITFFVDVCEYWAFKDVEEKGGFEDKNYKPATIIENQLKKIIQRRHDVQLHLHPQWINYEYIGEKKFKVDLTRWRLPNLNGANVEDKPVTEELNKILKKGKETLEYLLKSIDSSYECKSFRAGALCIQPEYLVLKGLIKNGFKYDTSVAPKLFHLGNVTNFDFRNIENLSEYPVSTSLDIKDLSGVLIERPILTVKFNLFDRVKFALFRSSALKDKPCGCEGTVIASVQAISQSRINKIWSKLKSHYKMLDITGIISAEEMMFMLSKALKKAKILRLTGEVPIVAISHCKNLGNEAEIDKFLRIADSSSFIKLESLNEKSAWRE